MKYGKILILGLLTISMVNCSSERENLNGSWGNGGGGGVLLPPPIDSDPINELKSGEGGTVTFVYENLDAFSDYVGETINDPQDLKLQVDLVADGDHYSGRIAISYTNDEQFRKGTFTTGGSRKAIKYNEWVDNGEKFHAVFEDLLDNGGGIVLVIDEVVDQGDGQGPEDLVGGSIWYKNFGQSPYPIHPRRVNAETYCWFVSLGPYDCRPWPSGKGMLADRSGDPSSKSGYKLLGTFSGLSQEEAFNQ